MTRPGRDVLLPLTRQYTAQLIDEHALLSYKLLVLVQKLLLT